MLWPMIPVALRWLHMDERNADRIDRELDEQTAGEAPPPARPCLIIREIHQLDATRSGSVQ